MPKGLLAKAALDGNNVLHPVSGFYSVSRKHFAESGFVASSHSVSARSEYS